MAHHLTALRPLWGFASGGPAPSAPPAAGAEPPGGFASVQAWTRGSDGRPRPRWTVGQSHTEGG